MDRCKFMKKPSLKNINLKNLNFKKLSFKLFKNLPDEQMRITLSTVITLLRIVLAPFIVYAMATQKWGIAFWLFVIAAATDVIDGNLARLFDEKTFLGACLDPIADKILLISCFATLAFVQSPQFSIPQWFVLLVLIKDTIIIVGSSIIFFVKGYLRVLPTVLGKLTTVAQVLFITWLFACYFCHWFPIKTYYAMLTIVSALSIISLLQYLVMGWRQWVNS